MYTTNWYLKVLRTWEKAHAGATYMGFFNQLQKILISATKKCGA
jgi:hypothetical protein